jgi:type I restriction enzyme S subunit
LDGIERCIDDEIPFDVPENWAWARLGTLIQLFSGQDMTPDKYNADKQGIPYLTGASNIENGRVIINRWTAEPKSLAIQGDLLITCKGTVGTMALLQCEKAHIARQIMSIRASKLLRHEYLHCFLETYVFALKSAAKSMIPGISRDDILTALVPLPPLAEQERIVERIGQLTAITERL